MNANSRTVLITGASSGFGKAIATALAARGDRVYGTSRGTSAGSTATVPWTHVTMDVRDARSVDSAVARVVGEAGRLDVVVNNAGFGIAGAIEDTTDEEVREQFDTNFFGVHRVCRAVLPHLRAQRSGHIVNVSSLAGLVAVPYQGFYCATKHAIEAYSEALRIELRPFGIQVSMLEPGDFATSFTANRRMVVGCTPDSPHHASCRRAVARMQADERRYTDLQPIVRTVLSAIDSPRPALRYPVAVALQRTLVALKPFMPQSWFERLIMDTYEIGK